ncbi:MAG: hypothetical protein WC654_05680 [Patescibacteria group bacterium]
MSVLILTVVAMISSAHAQDDLAPQVAQYLCGNKPGPLGANEQPIYRLNSRRSCWDTVPALVTDVQATKNNCNEDVICIAELVISESPSYIDLPQPHSQACKESSTCWNKDIVTINSMAAIEQEIDERLEVEPHAHVEHMHRSSSNSEAVILLDCHCLDDHSPREIRKLRRQSSRQDHPIILL